MNINTLKNNYPKSFEALKDWSLQIIKRTSGITSEVIDKIPIESVIQLVLSNSSSKRQLYDFMDSYNIYISIIRSEKGFIYTINQLDREGWLENRIQAEEFAYLEGFNILEKQL